jgi:hypothetical protein
MQPTQTITGVSCGWFPATIYGTYFLHNGRSDLAELFQPILAEENHSDFLDEYNGRACYAFDPLNPLNAHNYWKVEDAEDLKDVSATIENYSSPLDLSNVHNTQLMHFFHVSNCNYKFIYYNNKTDTILFTVKVTKWMDTTAKKPYCKMDFELINE